MKRSTKLIVNVTDKKAWDMHELNNLRQPRGQAGRLDSKVAENNDKMKTAVGYKHTDSMQVVIRPLIFFGQCFALLPVRGIFSTNSEDLIFTWKGKRTIYSLVVLATVTTVSLLEITSSLVLDGLTYKSVDNLISFVLAVVQMIIFMEQGRGWPRLISEWTKIEQKMKRFPPLEGLSVNIKWLVYVFGFGTMFLAGARIFGPMVLHMQCSTDFWDLLELTIFTKYYTLFSLIGFSPYQTVLMVALFIHQNVLMTFDELILTVLAYCLYLRFRQLQQHLQTIQSQRVPASYWGEMRETYNSLSCLTKLLDNHLSWMTLVCFAANLYHICSLLLKSISPTSNKVTSWTLLYVLVFTILRTFLSALMASNIHEESKKPLTVLFSVPNESYNIEVCRFQLQVTHDDIVITGCNFFSVTRSFMLTIAGTIATYEIVLLQFGSLNEDVEKTTNNTASCYKILHLIKS